jgi:hypothetical protein
MYLKIKFLQQLKNTAKNFRKLKLIKFACNREIFPKTMKFYFKNDLNPEITKFYLNRESLSKRFNSCENVGKNLR